VRTGGEQKGGSWGGSSAGRELGVRRARMTRQWTEACERENLAAQTVLKETEEKRQERLQNSVEKTLQNVDYGHVKINCAYWETICGETRKAKKEN